MTLKEVAKFGTELFLHLMGLSEGLFNACNNSYTLPPGRTVLLQSPYYPSRYPSGSACLYNLQAPLDYEIVLDCDLNLDKNTNSCSTEYFYISRDGDPDLTGAEQLCGTGNIKRTSLFRYLILAYISTAQIGSGSGGTFACKLTTQPQPTDCGWSQKERIIGGNETAINEYPSMVGLGDLRTQNVFCGGSIINHRTVITAAHCTALYSDAEYLVVLAGVHNLTKAIQGPNSQGRETKYTRYYLVESIIQHENYDPLNDINDIALVITTTDIEWSRGVGPICLPVDKLDNTFGLRKVDLVGWGTTSFAGEKSETLQKTDVLVLFNKDCKREYPELVASQLCTYRTDADACQLDSGGPCVYTSNGTQFLLGIISYGYGCARQPGVNTRVTSFIHWILTHATGNNLRYKSLYLN